MRQRVAFARTLLAGKPVLLLDEPFAVAGRDHARGAAGVAGGALAAEPRTVLLVTHDIEEALFLCDRVLVLSAAAGDGARRAAWLPPRRGSREARR